MRRQLGPQTKLWKGEGLFLMWVVSLDTLPDTYWGPINLYLGNHKGWKDGKWSQMLKVCFVHRNQKT